MNLNKLRKTLIFVLSLSLFNNFSLHGMLPDMHADEVGESGESASVTIEMDFLLKSSLVQLIFTFFIAAQDVDVINNREKMVVFNSIPVVLRDLLYLLREDKRFEVFKDPNPVTKNLFLGIFKNALSIVTKMLFVLKFQEAIEEDDAIFLEKESLLEGISIEDLMKISSCNVKMLEAGFNSLKELELATLKQKWNRLIVACSSASIFAPSEWGIGSHKLVQLYNSFSEMVLQGSFDQVYKSFLCLL